MKRFQCNIIVISNFHEKNLYLYPFLINLLECVANYPKMRNGTDLDLSLSSSSGVFQLDNMESRRVTVFEILCLPVILFV